jgi:hypothetical protein
MFNNALKARVDALCNELSALIRSEPDFATARSFQSQSQGADVNPHRDRQVFWQGRINLIGGPRILAFHPASERRTKLATPVFPPPSA